MSKPQKAKGYEQQEKRRLEQSALQTASPFQFDATISRRRIVQTAQFLRLRKQIAPRLQSLSFVDSYHKYVPPPIFIWKNGANGRHFSVSILIRHTTSDSNKPESLGNPFPE